MIFRHAASLSLVVAAALFGAACDSNDSPTAPTEAPVSITEAFPAGAPGTLTRNGGITHVFAVQQAGTISATMSTLTPEGTAVGLSIGSWNGSACSAGIARDDITQGFNVVGTATATGNYCVRVYDAAGSLAQPATYQLTVTHF